MEPYGRQRHRRVVCDTSSDRPAAVRAHRRAVRHGRHAEPIVRVASQARVAAITRATLGARAVRAARLNNRLREGPVHLPRVLFAHRQTTLTLARQKCAARASAPANASFDLDRERDRVAEHERLNLAGRIANSIRFPFNGFTYFLTLFSKSFSSFPHGTCSLSVSCPYLALDGVYHPFWAAFPNNPTLRKHIASAWALPRTGLSPSATCCSKQLRQAPMAPGKYFSKLQFAIATQRRFSSLSCSLFIRHY